MHELPRDAVAKSHELLVRAGYIRQSSAGVFSFLPFGQRVLSKIVKIVDEELSNIGGQKMQMPQLLTADSWKKTGRWENVEKELFTLQDRKKSDYCLGPTHEEVITELIATSNVSPRNLPLLLYQVGLKFRDEARPRGGLLRCREFLMKDMYSFDTDLPATLHTYQRVLRCYLAIFARLGLAPVVAAADPGNMVRVRGGQASDATKSSSKSFQISLGDGPTGVHRTVTVTASAAQKLSHEFHVVCDVGEDSLVVCGGCGYAANREAAVGHISECVLPVPSPGPCTGLHKTLCSLEEAGAAVFVGLPDADHAHAGPPVCVVLPAGRAPNSVSVEAAVRAAATPQLRPLAEAPTPPDMCAVCIDQSLVLPPHNTWQQLFPGHTVHFGAFAALQAGDGCATPTCRSAGARLDVRRGVEVGQVFVLGHKYSDVFGAHVDTPAGRAAMHMGCYGLGLTRILAVVAEQYADADGLVWPTSLAPYQVAVLVLMKQADPATTEAVHALYDALEHVMPSEVILDDRSVGPGAKIREALLVGYRWLVLVGRTFTDTGLVELRCRITGTITKHAPTDLPAYIQSQP